MNIAEVLATEDLSLTRLHEVRREVSCSIDRRTELESQGADLETLVRGFSSENKRQVRRGTVLWILGRPAEAVAKLEPARSGKERSYILGLCRLELGLPQTALASLKEVCEADPSDLLASAAYGEALILAGMVEEARSHVDHLPKEKLGAEARYLKGLLADVRGYHDEALKEYEKALELEPGHPKTLFRMAHLLDRAGEDDRALRMYEQLLNLRPMHVHTAMNLGVLYEDRGEYERALQCYQLVVDHAPTHARARLYLKDAHASLTMYYDEEATRREAKLQQVLAQLVAELSFSPRVRGALEKLGVTSLGDLVRRSEEDLLGVPNFGRTSLRELKDFLSSKGLALAGPAAVESPEPGAPVSGGPENPGLSQKKLADLEWSERIQKALEKMGLDTVGDLIQKTQKELLEGKVLGLTSIREIQEKLGALGLALREE